VGVRPSVIVIVVTVNRRTVAMIGVVVVRVRVDVWGRQRRGRAEQRGHEQGRQNPVQGPESTESPRVGSIDSQTRCYSPSMSRLASFVAVFVVAVCSVAGASRHEVTYKGTVVSADDKKVTVTVVNAKTKKPENFGFSFDKETKVLRGDKVVTYAQARIQKGEKIAVTVDHDLDENLALVIRLDEKK
jgi:hypothetical protein